MENMKGTVWDSALVVRQKYQEEIFRNAGKKHHALVKIPIELRAAIVGEATSLGNYRITATVLDSTTQREWTIKCRYLIGHDSGRLSLRRVIRIPFEDATTEDR